MKKETYERARLIRCDIQDLNATLDTIERLRIKYKDDKELELILINSHSHNYNEIQRLERAFSDL